MLNVEVLLGVLCFFSSVFCTQRLLIDQLRWEFFEFENEFWNVSGNSLLNKELEESELYLVKRFYEFDQKLKQMPQDYLRGLKPLRTFSNFILLYLELKDTDNNYEKFREYQKALIHQSSNNVTTKDIIDTILNNKTGVKISYEYMYDLMYYQHGTIVKGPFKMADDNFWCKNYEQSPQQLAYNFYNVIALSELKAYVMQQFALLANTLWNIGKSSNLLIILMIKEYFELSIKTRKKYEEITIRKIERVKKAMMYPRDIWKCDPEIFVKGETYDEFTRLLQGHIQNEEDMNPKRRCTNSCTDYCYAKSYGCKDLAGNFCRKAQKCNGAIIGCNFIGADATICLADSPLRRYDYVNYSGKKTLGKQHVCPTKKNVDISTRWPSDCHYCMCLCDEHGPKSDRYINLRPVMADIKNNRVVTGLRLVKHNRLLHIQIQEGQLLPHGYINESTVHWKELDDYKITDKGVLSGQDYFTLTYENRTMALDEIQASEDSHVITGVRFEKIDNRVQFAIHVSFFNWHKGTVEQNWHPYMATNSNGGPEICVSTTDVPILTNTSSQIHFTGDVVFTHTDFEKDAAQTTIPFIDTQDVVNKPAVPLMGAGLYYKGADGYGGFIAPRIKTYDFAKHITNSLPTHDLRNASD